MVANVIEKVITWTKRLLVREGMLNHPEREKKSGSTTVQYSAVLDVELADDLSGDPTCEPIPLIPDNVPLLIPDDAPPLISDVPVEPSLTRFMKELVESGVIM